MNAEIDISVVGLSAAKDGDIVLIRGNCFGERELVELRAAISRLTGKKFVFIVSTDSGIVSTDSGTEVK